MNRRHADWALASIERQGERRRSETGFRDWVATRARRSDGISDMCRNGVVGRPLVGGLGRGLYEVRTTFDKNEYRVFFHVERDEVVVLHSTMVLVHGIHKKTQKTPAADIELTRRRMKEGT